MTDLTGAEGLMVQRLAGAVAGSAVSLAYLVPKNRREAASRFFSGLACGLVFGGPTGLWLSQVLALGVALSPSEIMLSGSAAASLCAWWGLGVLSRLAGRYQRSGAGTNGEGGDAN